MKKIVFVLVIAIIMVFFNFYVELITFGMGRYPNYTLIKYASSHWLLFVIIYIFRLFVMQFVVFKLNEKLKLSIVGVVFLSVLNLYLLLQSFLSLVAGVEHLKLLAP